MTVLNSFYTYVQRNKNGHWKIVQRGASMWIYENDMDFTLISYNRTRNSTIMRRKHAFSCYYREHFLSNKEIYRPVVHRRHSRNVAMHIRCKQSLNQSFIVLMAAVNGKHKCEMHMNAWLYK